GGGEEFGEVQDDFGADENEELDFSDLPEEALPSAGDGVVLDLPPDTAGAPAKPVAREGGEAKPAGSGKLRWALGAAALLALLIGGGYALKFTSLGAFGIYSLEGFLPASGDDAEVQGKIAEAERRAAADTYSGVRSGLRVLGEARAEASLNRLLMARSIVHEALYQVRFGPNARSEARESALLQKLAQRSNDAPGMSLALAASALRRGELRLAERQVQLALREDPRDPYGHLVAGELALAKEDANAATEAFAQAGRAGARAAWGTARAQLMAGEASLAAQAIEATLDESPGHAGARVASAAAARDAGRMERALRLAREAAGAAEVEGQGHIRASPTERARALTLVGEILMERGRRMAAGRAFEAAVDADPFAFRALLGLGNVLLIERRFTDALARFESAASAMAEAPPPREGEPPNAVRVGLGQVEALLDLEQVQRGSRMAADLAEVHPREPSVALWNGRALEALAKPEEAMAEYQRCVTLDAGGFDGYLAQAMLHFGNEDLEAAGTILAEARENVRMTARVHRQLGELELRRGNLGAAERELREAVRLDGNDPVARFALGQVRRRQGALDEAGALFDALAEADPSYPGLALERGRLFEAQGQAERAVQEYTRAAQQSPDDFDLLLRLGGAQLAAGNLEAAEETLRRVQEERPESAEAEYFMGRVAYARGENTTALTRLARAVSLDPRVGEYHLYLAKALLEKGEIGRSRAEVEQALELDDSLAEGYLLRGTIRLRLGRRTPAIDDFKRCLELRPGDGRAQVGMGEAYEELQDRERAIAAFQRAVELDGTQGEWWYRLGSVLLDAGRPGDAVTALAKATEIGDGVEAGDAPALPTWVFDAHRIRGDALRLAGRRADARGHYQRYLELAPDSALDREAVEARLERL
ncbi:MAG: tetratricopeptide repeat protein, partial [Myxococcota bacterium]